MKYWMRMRECERERSKDGKRKEKLWKNLKKEENRKQENIRWKENWRNWKKKKIEREK